MPIALDPINLSAAPTAERTPSALDKLRAAGIDTTGLGEPIAPPQTSALARLQAAGIDTTGLGEPVEFSAGTAIVNGQSSVTDQQKRQAFEQAGGEQGFTEKFYSNMGPVFRGAARGGDEVGQFIVNSALRGIALIPGMQGADELADRNNRLMAAKRAYDENLDRTGDVAALLGPDAAQFAGTVSSTVGEGVLLGGLGKATRMASSKKGLTAFMAAAYGVKRGEQELTVARDLFPDDPVMQVAHPVVVGGVEGLFTKWGSAIGAKFGLEGTEEILARGLGRSVSNLLSRSGVTKELAGYALEGGEEASIELAKMAWGELNGSDSMEGGLQRIVSAFAGGAATRGTLAAGQRLASSINQAAADLPDTVRGAIEVQDAKIEGREPEVPEDASPAFKSAVESELEALAELDAELQAQFSPLKEEKAALQTELDTLLASAKAISEMPETSFADKALIAEDVEGGTTTRGQYRAQLQKDIADLESIRAEYERSLSEVDISQALRPEQRRRIARKLDKATKKLNEYGERLRPLNKAAEEAAGIRIRTDQVRKRLAELTEKESALGEQQSLLESQFAELTTPTTEAKPADPKADALRKMIAKLPARETKLLVERDVLEAHLKKVEGDELKTAEVRKQLARLASKESQLETEKELLDQRLKELGPEQAEPAKTSESGESPMDVAKEAAIQRAVDAVDKRRATKSAEVLNTVKQEHLNALRERVGLLGVPDAERQASADILARARAKGIPQRAYAIAVEFRQRPRPMNSEETLGLGDALYAIGDDVQNLSKAHDAAKTNREKTGIQAQMQEKVHEMDTISEALYRTGSEQGRALAIRQMALRSDLSFPNVVKRAKDIKQAPLTPGEIGDLRKTTDKLDRVNTKRLDAVPGSQREIDMDYLHERLRMKLQDKLNKLKPPTLRNRVGGPVGGLMDLWRAWQQSFDGPPLFRQGLTSTTGHPLLTLKSIPSFFKAFSNERNAHKLEFQIFNGPNAELHKEAGLHLLRPDDTLNFREDQLMSSIADRLPEWSLVPKFQRGFRAWVNTVRSSTFDALVDARGGPAETTPEVRKAIADFINVGTGRGGLGGMENSAHGLAKIFLAPRWVSSRFQFATGVPFWRALASGDSMATRVSATEYARVLGGLALGTWFLEFVAQSFWPESKIQFHRNPLSKDFGKLQVNNTRVDITGGLALPLRLAASAADSAYTWTQNRKVRYGKPREPETDLMSSLGYAVSSKLAPQWQLLLDVVSGESAPGQPISLSGAVKEFGVPWSPSSVYDALREEGFSPGAAIAVMDTIGAGSYQRTAKE